MNKSNNQNQWEVSIVIPTLLSSPNLLKQCLSSLTKQSFDASRFEVILIGNCSNKQLNDFISECSDLPKNFVYKTLNQNMGFARSTNIGINLASSPLVMTLNDDVLCDKSFVANMLKAQKNSAADMVAATIYKADGKSLDSCGIDFAWRGKAWPLTIRNNELSSSLSDLPDNWMKNLDLLSGSDSNQNLFKQPFGPDAAAGLYTRKLIEKVGAFNESFYAYLEDVDLALRARRAGFYCVWADDACVIHFKHQTSGRMGKFKQWQDIKNWWRIVRSYPFLVWQKFGLLILWERVKNLKGLVL